MFKPYTAFEHDPWQKDHILMLDMHSLFESPKVALNFSRNASKSFSKGDWCSNKGVNQAKVVLDNKVLMSSTWTRQVGYRWGSSWMTKCIWLTKPQNFESVPSNLSSMLIYASLVRVVFLKCIPKRSKLNWFANEE